jgi:threonine/homoserine/homoserine lactone efflux protein
MNYFFDGIKVGFLLIFLIGPIFFSLIHMGVEYGTKVGVFFGSGIWISDIFLFMGMYKGMSFISEIANASYFYYTVGGIGTLILMVFGLAAIIQKGNHSINVPQAIIKQHSPRSLFGFFLKGVLINIFNPFTILFWLGLMSTALVDKNFGSNEAVWYFAGIMSIYVPVDLFKIFLAKKIRKVLKPSHLKLVSNIAGIALIIFGIVLFIRVFVIR